MSNSPFSFEYGEEEAEEKKKTIASVKKKAKVVKKLKAEDKTTPIPLEGTQVSTPEDTTVVSLPIEESPVPVSAPVSIPQASTIVSVPPQETDKPSVGSDTTVVAVVATAVVATGVAVLAKGGHLKKLRSKSKSPKQDHKSQDQQKREEKKKEEQTKCDAKSKEVQSLIDETNKEFESLESNFLKFVGLEEDKEFSESISSLKDELKKLKKAIKEFE